MLPPTISHARSLPYLSAAKKPSLPSCKPHEQMQANFWTSAAQPVKQICVSKRLNMLEEHFCGLRSTWLVNHMTAEARAPAEAKLMGARMSPRTELGEKQWRIQRVPARWHACEHSQYSCAGLMSQQLAYRDDQEVRADTNHFAVLSNWSSTLLYMLFHGNFDEGCTNHQACMS